LFLPHKSETYVPGILGRMALTGHKPETEMDFIKDSNYFSYHLRS